jgi:RimJ/RimL family protein N-acetyltransferase
MSLTDNTSPGPARRLPIETASLTLRPFVPGDARKLFQMSQEESMRAWLPSQVYRDEADAASVLAALISQCRAPADPRIGPYVIGVEVRNSGELVGHVGFSPLGDAVEVGFAIDSAHQGKGIATEAVRAACEWAAEQFSTATILGVTSGQNIASQRVLLRAGFAWQKDEVMRFQGREQAVVVFAFAAPRQTVHELVGANRSTSCPESGG